MTESESDDGDENDSGELTGDYKSSNFIVHWSCILSLLRCFTCMKAVSICNSIIVGTQLILHMICSAGHSHKWCSQPFIRRQTHGNLLVSAAILFTGYSYQRIKEFMEISKIKFISKVAFYRIQKHFLFPAVHKVYTLHRELRFQSCLDAEDKLDLIGDGRCDSPGYNADYDTYTLMNLKSGEILAFHVIHVGEVENSSRMEKVGMIKVLERVGNAGISINSLTTDRHIQIRKYLKEERNDINHQFDIWHVSNSIKKKLVKLSGKKSARDLQPWIKSVINHIWWCCASCEGNPTILKEKWFSLLHHVSNRHHWEGNTYYKKCAHAKRSEDDIRIKKWLREGATAFIALEKVVRDKLLVRDLKYLVEFKHTASLEVYHALYNKYCPKRLHFSYSGMVARSQLAVLDHNASTSSKHAQTKDGKLRFKHQYSKVSGASVVKKNLTKKVRAIQKIW